MALVTTDDPSRVSTPPPYLMSRSDNYRKTFPRNREGHRSHTGILWSNDELKRRIAVTLQRRTPLSPVIALLVGLLGSVGLAVFWHLIVGTAKPRQAGYLYTQYFTDCLSLLFAAVYFLLSIALGWTVRRPLLVAAGMILPLPIALAIETVLDPTSHNLLPFEVILYWLPAFGIALLGAFLGRVAASHPSNSPIRADQANRSL